MPVAQFDKPIVLVGFMGAGKSAIGRLVAPRLGFDFSDSDDAIVDAAGMSIAEIFERDGEAFFREKERQVIQRLLDEGTAFLSTGGGAFLSDENQALLLERAHVVWLRADMDVTWERVNGNDKRPLLRVENAREVMEALYAQRAPRYQNAHVTWDAQAGESKEDAASRLYETIVDAFSRKDK